MWFETEPKSKTIRRPDWVAITVPSQATTIAAATIRDDNAILTKEITTTEVVAEAAVADTAITTINAGISAMTAVVADDEL